MSYYEALAAAPAAPTPTQDTRSGKRIPQDPDVLARAIAALPKCYSAEVNACIEDFYDAGKENRGPRGCLDIYPVWLDPSDAWWRWIDAVPFCSAPAKPDYTPLIAVGALGLIAGFVAAKVSS